MTEASTPQSSPPPEQLPWGISYLREDIQDLRQDLRESIQELRGEIQKIHQELRGEIQEVRQEIRTLHSRIDETSKSLSGRIDERYELLLRQIFGKRLVKTPKVYFTDVGTLCYLAGLKDPRHAAAGPLGAASRRQPCSRRS